ncbi:Gfo/Idh/MocA family oxidoreductase [Patescibacteria group bacterium AH-259-L05]|nr:Gfo/Idh/MocA family oxidoreductase [Patescibacteria group bacterium AH-259-L05]
MIKIAILGAGYWGPNLIRNFYAIEDVDLHSVCDYRDERLDFIKKQYPDIVLTKNFDDILNNSEIEAVIIALPAQLHYEFGKKALDKGKHVFIEKPLATKVSEAKKLITLSEKNKKILMTGHTFLYNDAVRKAKEYIDKGELGKIHYIYFQRLNLGRVRDDVNAMWNFAPHDISVALYWLNQSPLRVSAHGVDYLQDGIEDVVFLNLEFPDKVFVQIHTSWIDPNKVRRAVIVGSKKMLVYDDVSDNTKIQLFDKGIYKKPSHIREELAIPKTQEEFKLFIRKGDIHIPHFTFREPLHVECSHFIECIKKNKQPLSDGYNGLAVVKILEAGQTSLKSDAKKIQIT